MMMKPRTLIFILAIAVASCRQTATYDLAITHATVFDSKKGSLSLNQTILIKAGNIVDVRNDDKNIAATNTIDAKGKLVTPGFIDTHIHPTDVFGDYDAAPEYLSKDSLSYLRKKLSDAYLPYGVTTAMMMGQPEKWLLPILDWSAYPSPNHLNVYTVGGALISKESRKPYISHITVETPTAAKQKILEYYRLGVRHIKLYWRLRRPEFEAAFATADSL